MYLNCKGNYIMSIMKTTILTLGLVLCTFVLSANTKPYAAFEKGDGRTVIVDNSLTAPIVLDKSGEWPGVRWAAASLAEDILKVTGKKPEIKNYFVYGPRRVTSIQTPSIIVGTLGKSAVIEQYLSAEDKAGLEGAREKYILKTLDGNVIIAGSDKRGTTYGIYALSAAIGVSPWYWWADVPVKQHKELYVINGSYTEGEPGVYYRGIFLNDEAPALTGWVNANTDGYKSEFYKKVFELLLRLKGNFLWPAMWDAAFYDDDPLNMYYADAMGIIMSTSHHEPCARAQKEWHRYGNRIWDYSKNKKVLDEFWLGGIKRMKDTEDVVTIGMRGDGDMAMEEGTNIALLEKVVEGQRKVIEKGTGKPADQTPQVWALYKEVQDYYDKGMRVPDDVTILLADDNWGNVRKLPSLDERPRKGGYGMYYHFDYVGEPRCSKWLNCNQIERSWEQLNLCYEYGVRKLWVVNVGDLKPMEYPIQFFMDMAWNPEAFNPGNLFQHTKDFAGDQFGSEYAEEVGEIIKLYSKYARRITPELLNAKSYSFDYNEWPQVVSEWKELELRALRVYQTLDPLYYDAFEELVLFPIQAMQNIYEMYYAHAMNLKAESAKEANKWAAKVEQLYKRDSVLNAHYNHEIAGGKWNHMMDQPHIGYTYWGEPRVQVMPTVGKADESGLLCHEESEAYVSIEAGNFKSSNGITVIPDFGKTECGITTLPATKTPDNAYVEYEIETTSSGKGKVRIYLAPTLNFNANVGLCYALSVDGGSETVVNFNGPGHEKELNRWESDYVIKSELEMDFAKAGRHSLRFRFVDPGICLEKIEVDFGGLKPSYLGAPSSKLIK